MLAVSRKTGKILWQQTVHKELPHEAGHVTASLASASPVTDGEHVFAFFGSRGLYCLDTDGKLLWKKDLGEMHTKHGHGEGSSPALSRRHADRQLGPRRTIVSRRPRQTHRQAALASGPRRGHLLGDADRGRARRARPRSSSPARIACAATTWPAARSSGSAAGCRPTSWRRRWRPTASSTPAAATTRGPCWPSASTAPRATSPGPTRSLWTPPPRHALRAVAAAVRRLALHLQHYQGIISRAGCQDGRRPGRPVSAGGHHATSTPRRSAPPAASTSPAATASRRS